MRKRSCALDLTLTPPASASELPDKMPTPALLQVSARPLTLCVHPLPGPSWRGQHLRMGHLCCFHFIRDDSDNVSPVLSLRCFHGGFLGQSPLPGGVPGCPLLSRVSGHSHRHSQPQSACLPDAVRPSPQAPRVTRPGTSPGGSAISGRRGALPTRAAWRSLERGLP